MRPWWGVTVALAIIFAAGEGLVLLLKVDAAKPGRLGRAATAFLLGVAMIGTWSLIVTLLSLPASPLLLAAPVLLYPAGRMLRKKNGVETPPAHFPPAAPGGGSVLSRLAGAVVLFQVLYVFHHALTRPIHAWDAWKIWSFKAKVIFLESGFPADFFSGTWAGFPGYPLGIPMVEAFLAHAAGEWHETAVKVIFPLFYIATLILFTLLLRIIGRQKAVPLGLLLMAPAPLLVHHGAVAYMDLPLGCFLLAAVTWLCLWEKEGDSRFLILAALHAGFLPLVKNEGLPLYLLLTFIFFYRARRGRKPAVDIVRWLGPSLLLCLPWLAFKYGAAVGDSPYHHLAFPGFSGMAERCVEILRHVGASLFLSGSWGIAWYPLLLLPLLWKRTAFGTPAIVLAGGFLIFGAAYALTDSYIFLMNGTALGRNLLVLLPLGVTIGVSSLYGDAAELSADG